MLSDILKEGRWENVYCTTNIDVCVDKFYVKILNAVERSRFLSKVNAKNKRLKEWMTLGLLNSTRTKHELSKKVKKHCLNINLRSYYKKYADKLSCLIRAAKINFYKNAFSTLMGNPKLTWNSVKEITGEKKTIMKLLT